MTPSSKLLALLGVAAVGPLSVALLGFPYILGVGAILLVLLVAILDRKFGTRRQLTVARNVSRVLSVGIDNAVTLEVHNADSVAVSLEVIDEPPEGGVMEPCDPMTVQVGGHEKVLLTYSFVPSVRGRFVFAAVQLRHHSRLGLWRVLTRHLLESEIQVYPNIEALSRFELLARKNNLAELGFMATRMRGDGHEFERMREYRQGDEPRRVDWKTTARTGRLIVREMGQDRNQNVLFLLDMGRMMQQTEGGLSHFDFALNTAIMLGHIARKKGDSIGAVLFSNKVHRYIPMSRGYAAVDALVNATYDIEPDAGATNYARAFEYVMTHVHKRSLVILMTHFIPGEDQRLIRAYTQQLGRQHLPLCVFFKEPSLEAELNEPPESVNEAYRKAAAADLVMARIEALSALKSAGVMAIESLPGDYTAQAISHYLDIKARNLL